MLTYIDFIMYVNIISVNIRMNQTESISTGPCGCYKHKAFLKTNDPGAQWHFILASGSRALQRVFCHNINISLNFTNWHHKSNTMLQ